MATFARRYAPACLVALLLWIGVGSTVWAAPVIPTWRERLWCDAAAQKHRGLEYCTAAAGQVHVVVVDLQSPGIGLEYVIAEGLNKTGQFGECQDVNVPAYGPVRGGCADKTNPAYYPVMPLDRAVEIGKSRTTNLAVVINSDYGAGDQGKPGEFRGHGPEGLTVVRGTRLDGPTNGDKDINAINRPWLAVSRDAPLRAELSQLAQDDGGKAAWVYTGVGGGPWLIRSGVIQTEDIQTCRNCPGSCYEGAVQTAVGLSQDHRWLFLVIDSRKGKLMDTAQFMREQLAAWDAIKFDGGGSSQLWYSGQFIARGDGRQLSQYLAVIAPPGSGIQDTVPSPSLTDQLKALIERLRQTAERQLDKWRQQAEEAVRRWVAELERQASEWLQRELERQVQSLVEQVCGSALAPMALVVWLTTRRRRR